METRPRVLAELAGATAEYGVRGRYHTGSPVYEFAILLDVEGTVY